MSPLLVRSLLPGYLPSISIHETPQASGCPIAFLLGGAEQDHWCVSWQVVPDALIEMLQDGDREKSRRVMAAMLTMKTISIAALRRAYEGGRPS
jgi:hypothetical protein